MLEIKEKYIPTKSCTKCKKIYPATTEYFYKKEGGKYGIRAVCKQCNSKYSKSRNNQLNTDPNINKICSKCGNKYPATTKYFHKNKSSMYGLQACCKGCKAKHNKEYRERPKVIQRIKEYENRPDIKEKRRKRDKERMRKIKLEDPEKYKRRIKLIALHRWVIRRIPTRPDICPECEEKGKIELSNISGNYKKDINDWQWLCQKCHINFDKINKTHSTPSIVARIKINAY